MSKTRTRKVGTRRPAGRRPIRRRYEEPATICPESLRPVVAIIDERVSALERLLKTPGIGAVAARQIAQGIRVLLQCKKRVLAACAKGGPPYYMPRV